MCALLRIQPALPDEHYEPEKARLTQFAFESDFSFYIESHL